MTEPSRQNDRAPGNGLDLGFRHLRVTGTVGLVALMVLVLAGALGYIVWNIAKEHTRIIELIYARCVPIVHP